MTDHHDDAVFHADWLSLREPVDHRSRPAAALEWLAESGAAAEWRVAVDLGGGTGSNVRYLAPRLPQISDWRVVDHDRSLLDRIANTVDQPVTLIQGDLAQEGLRAVDDAHLVTASALLDLVTEEWLTRLAARCAEGGAGVLLALSYDGRIALNGPEDEDDAWIIQAVNEHQRGEKGMGRALGPDAAEVAQAAFASHGYETRLLDSPWILDGAADAPLAVALMSGWADAVGEVHPQELQRVRDWLRRRTEAARQGRLRVTVGHQDLVAKPGASS